MITNVVVLGGGSAGLIAALTLKCRLPQLSVRVIRSPDIGIIGVGEGTTAAFPRHIFQYLKLSPQQFYAEAEPTWKLGIRFLWGTRREFYYTFAKEYEHRWPELARNTGFYHDAQTGWVGQISALMAHNKAFFRQATGAPQFHNNHAFHIENVKLVEYLENRCREHGVALTNGTMREVERGPEGIAALRLEDGERVTADLFVDASGFRSELLGRALGERAISFDRSLFCDRAVIGGWPRTDEEIAPYTVAETMDAGWCWQIEHEHWINRGYVYSSHFISDEEALSEFRRKNPKIASEPRVIRFCSGRYERNWVGNVVAVGNAVGFVEPLEATAIQVICVQSSSLADTLIDSLQEPTPTLVKLYNQYNGEQWDDIRDFLAVHYAFNTRLNSPFWQACRAETELCGAQPLVDYYRENGPSVLAGAVLLKPTNSFALEGYLAMMVGQEVQHGKPHRPPAAEQEIWRNKIVEFGRAAKRGLSVKECLTAIRHPDVTLR